MGNFYWGEIEKERMEKYLELIEKDGFSVFKEKLYFEDRNLYDFIFSEVRADWRFCLEIKNNWRVLDAGAGLGANAFVLAREAAEVFALEKSFLRAKFLKLRKEEEKQNNLKILVGDALILPFEDNSFDLVVANGLFEWLGTSEEFKSPAQAQRRFLEEARRVLKKDGYLYIGIENRLALVYFFGGRDHSGLRLTSWMPRVLANFYTKLKTKKEYRTYTYTKKSYGGILRKAGFKNIEFFLPLAGYNIPKYIVPYEHLKGLKFLASQVLGGTNWRKKILKKAVRLPLIARVWRFFFFSFAIFCQK